MNFKYSIFLAFIICLGSCTGLKKLEQGYYLYNGSDIEIKTEHEVYNEGDLTDELSSLIEPGPNGKVLWMRPALSIYNTMGQPQKEKGLKNWIKKKMGEPPVYLSEVDGQAISKMMENRLYHRGYFNATVNYLVNKKSKTGTLTFEVQPGQAYLIDSVIYPTNGDTLSMLVQKLREESLIVPGEPYSLNNLQNERARIEKFLKNEGYYYFRGDYFKFVVDSTVNNHKVNIYLKLKENLPEEATSPQTINHIYVYPEHSLNNDSQPDTFEIYDYHYIPETYEFKPKVILNSIFLEEGNYYSKSDHTKTLNYLMGLGVFKYANLEFHDVEGKNDKLNASIYTTPHSRYVFSSEFNVITKSNNFTGPGIRLTLKDRNLLGGAEKLSINLDGRFEVQLNGGGDNVTNYELGIEPVLEIPRFYPFRLKKLAKQYVPITQVGAGFRYLKRVGLYTFNSFNLFYGFNWRSNPYITHNFRPIDINLVKLTSKSQEFEDYLEQNPSIKRSFEEQFILGTNYNYIYTNEIDNKRNYIYFRGEADFSGNLMSLVNGGLSFLETDSTGSSKVLGIPYSQFSKFTTDFRYYFGAGEKSKFATRLILGAGIPYGNSDILPYVKQYYIGGTNSIRAFVARSVGPGSYLSPNAGGNLLVDQTGELKLETNIEYRFPIISMLKGALFVDAGNIWLIDEDPNRPGSGFSGDFFKEIAMGTGFGLRVDADFFVFRLDWAFPLRIPNLPEGERWVIDDIAFGNKSWRKQNLIWNIAIGYPF
ncbi:BamA/TamA family outer membrane protein [Flexithrix dorotheae]|uniref:translocation and assembly module lipoprotein TamL n=1 Tax=Flexithrix dorotheae TaxID=70993 RepID=UPI0003A47F02|nr:BamA/TamA family outer membrane protein [Flexithrix dorotheae]